VAAGGRIGKEYPIQLNTHIILTATMREIFVCTELDGVGWASPSLSVWEVDHCDCSLGVRGKTHLLDMSFIAHLINIPYLIGVTALHCLNLNIP